MTTPAKPSAQAARYRALVEVDWEARGKRVSLSPDDAPTGDIPPKALAFFLSCNAVEEVSADDRS